MVGHGKCQDLKKVLKNLKKNQLEYSGRIWTKIPNALPTFVKRLSITAQGTARAEIRFTFLSSNSRAVRDTQLLSKQLANYIYKGHNDNGLNNF